MLAQSCLRLLLLQSPSLGSPWLSMTMFMPGYLDCSRFFSWIVYGWFAPLLGTEPWVMESPMARILISPL
jgi:hypothetical protein